MKKRLQILIIIVILVGAVGILGALDLERLQNIHKGGVRLNDLANDNDHYMAEDIYEPGFIPMYIVLREQYDTDKLYEKVRNMPKKQRREYTVTTLKEFSETTQKDLINIISELEAQEMVSMVRPLWITNVIGMRATIDAIEIFDRHPDVGLIEYDPLQYVLMDDPFEDDEDSACYNSSLRLGVVCTEKVTAEPSVVQESNVRAVRCTEKRERRRDSGEGRTAPAYRDPADNVAHHNAPDVWEMGYMGQGAIVSVIDTGVNYNHHDIRDQMWEHPDFPFHGYNTFANTTQTMDDHRHGSHCAGTVAGNGASGTITGIAPRATIMALKCLSNSGNGEEQMYWQAVQFSVEHGADILSVSLGWRYSGNPNRAEFRRVMANTLNAGVVASIAAGNESTSGLRTPGDTPPPWLHPDQTNIGGLSATVTVGATNLNDEIANFSSRGPVTWQTVEPYNDYPLNPGIGLIQPDICAVGVDVLSLVHNSNTTYRTMSGTSMATPAVAGVMALLLSKNQNLTPEDISQILEETAIPMTETKSNIFGSGLVNPVEAIDAAAFIAIHEVTYNDGNNNIPEYGEVLHINMTLINLGIEEAEDIFATLSTEDEYIEILQDRAEFGEIEQDSIVTVNDAYTIQIADNIPDRHEVLFNLNIGISEDHNWDFPFTMEVRAPKLITLVPQIYDYVPGGNNNSFIDPGEEVTLYLPLKNAGGSNSLPIELDIWTDSEIVEIVEIPRIDFEPVWSDETIYPEIRLSISEEAEYEDMLNFSYTVETGNYLFEGRFAAIVGGMVPAYLGAGETVTEPNEASPINIYFKSLRSQTVYTVEELNDAGVNGVLPITQLGYYIFGAPIYALPNFQIRIKHTDAENAAEHDDGELTRVYRTHTYLPATHRWDLLTLDEPFMWNGRDNILIDTAFSPVEDWSDTGQIRVYDVPDGFRYVRADRPTQADVSTRDVSSSKPQMLMIFDTVMGGDYPKAENLTAELIGADVRLSWEAPELDDRSREKDTTKRRRYTQPAARSNFDTRNPDGYNIYRNGIRLNDEPVDDTEYFDNDYNPAVTYYYYVTAVYDEDESMPSNVVTVRFRTATPEIRPPAEIQYDSFQLSIICDTPESTIYYTLDGSEPDAESNLYEEPFNISTDTVVKAIAYKEEWLPSEIAEKTYSLLYSPTDLSASGKVNSVYLSWEAPSNEQDRKGFGNIGEKERPSPPLSRGQAMLYRRRSSSPVRESYQNPQEKRNLIGYNIYRSASADSFMVINSEPVEEEEYLDENIPAAGQLTYYVTAVYTAGESLPTEKINTRSIAAKPVFYPEPGEFMEPFYLTIRTGTEGADIYYTLDETEPDEDAILYVDSLYIDATVTIKAAAFLTGWQESEIAEGLFEFATGIEEEEMLPVYATELLHAYPNPFNPETVIQFTLKEADYVNIEVYNIRGRKVKTLLSDNFDRGRHQVVWRGMDEYGRQQSSGIYFYRMKTSDYEQVRKVLMLK